MGVTEKGALVSQKSLNIALKKVTEGGTQSLSYGPGGECYVLAGLRLRGRPMHGCIRQLGLMKNKDCLSN